MKPLKALLILPGIVLGLTMLFFTKCQNDTTVGIPFNKDSAQIHFIPVNAAAELTSNFRKGTVELSRQLKDPTYLTTKFSMPLAEEFNRDAIAALLNQPAAKGMRIYLGQDKNGLIRMVLVGVDKQGNDITGVSGKIVKFTSDNADAVILEAGQRCPTLCSAPGALNQ